MSSSEITSQETRRSETILMHRMARLHRVKPIVLSVVLFVLPLAIFSLVQYLRYGSGLFLGWDSSTYAWSASVFSKDPIRYLFLNVDYPSLYVVILAGFSSVVGQVSLAEKILPFVVALPLGYAYYRLTLAVTSDRRLGYLAALLGGLTVNTLRLESDLNRNMLSFSVSMLLGFLVAHELSDSSFSLRNRWKRLLPVWLPLLAVVAYSQIETYLVLSLSLLLLVSLTRNPKTSAFTGLLVALPIIVALPLVWTFLLNYPARIRLIAIAPVSTLSILAQVALFLGGFGFPFTVIGLMTIAEKARRRNLAALFVIAWLAILVILLPIAIVLGLPYDRFLYVLPVPMIAAAGLKPLVRFASSGANIFHLKLLARFNLKVLRRSLIPIGFTLLLIATVATSISTTDSFLRPYVSQSDVSRLNQAAIILRQEGLSQPILVMYGPLAADVNSIYRAYFGIDASDSFAYYGKLQYVFTLPNPANVYSWKYDPPFEMVSSLRYRAEILNQLGNISITSRPIVIAGGNTYDRALSEVFISKFETSPGSGIYIIPPDQLQPSQVDYWRLYAYSDWMTKTSSYASNATWAQAQQVLAYLGRGPGAQFNANYSISLAHSWTQMEFTLRFYDWHQPYVFPDTSNATLAPFQVLFDNQPILTHDYTVSGSPSTITLPLQNVQSGLHSIMIRSVSNSTNTAVAIALDDIQVCPMNCS